MSTRRDHYKPVYQPHPLRDAAVAVRRTLTEYALLMRLHRPVGIWLLMWPTLWALWLAGEGRPDQRVLVLFMLGVVVMRSAGCIINDYADREFDPHVRRTASRPLAAGRVTPNEALALFVGLGLIGVAIALLLDPLTRLYAVAGAVFTVTYPYLKRFVQVPQFYLGLAFGWSIPMAFAELTGGVPRIGWLMLVANVLWSVVYDTMYAMVDREDDRRIGVKSTALLFGDADRAIIGAMQVMVVVALALVGREAGLGTWYDIGLGLGALMFAWEQWLIRHRDADSCFRAFNHAHYFGMAVFVGLALDQIYR
jgi:4-hydroxybenzoate polyprenyltransferase